MTDVVVIVPMLGRATQVQPLVESLHASTDRARPLFMCTHGDDDVITEVREQGLPHLVMPPRERGDYAAKINAGVALSDEPLILTGAIDIRFRAGWLEACESHLSQRVRVVGTNDLANERTATGHSTHSLVARDYVARGLIDGRPGLLCEDYIHEYVDDELVGTARLRGAYAHAPEAIVEHLHPMAGKAEWDDTYLRMRQRMHADRALFRERCRLWT